ncbi:MAG: hypothetical protein ABIZ80_26290, partial [Bryobacteraceae bacterium]
PSWKANLRTQKNTAYAWRQMIFFLSCIDGAEVSVFLAWARPYVERCDAGVKRRLLPALEGLEWVARGGGFDASGIGGETGGARRLRGWTTGRQDLRN